MRILSSIVLFISISFSVFAAKSDRTIYSLPENLTGKVNSKSSVAKTSKNSDSAKNSASAIDSSKLNSSVSSNFMLAGTKKGLFKYTDRKSSSVLWDEGTVSEIFECTETLEDGSKSKVWYFLTSAGILTSRDLKNFEYRNEGLPFLTIKQYDGKNISFVKQIAQLKDLAVHPTNPKILVTATKDAVYITYDGGASWKSIGSSGDPTSGIKAVAVADMARANTGKAAVTNADGTVTPAVAPKTDLVVFMAHSIFGFAYCYPRESKISWKNVGSGFDVQKTQTYSDEISDILPVVKKDANGFDTTEVYVSQTFMPKIYRFNWAAKKGEKIFTGKEPVDTIDALFFDGANLIYSQPGEIASFNIATKTKDTVPSEIEKWKQYFSLVKEDDVLYSAWVPYSAKSGEKSGISLGELWLLYPDSCNNKYAEKATDRKAVYVQAHKLMTKNGIDKYKRIIKNNNLDAMVIDMKDDYGGIRFDPKDPLLKKLAFVSTYKIDIDTFVPAMKEAGIYLVARIVTFKDKNLWSYGKNEYAVWDSSTKRPWQGIQYYEEVKDSAGKVTGSRAVRYDEHWVDPYSHEVWEYNMRIARELVERGFDEIQFDYIRFPTDGRNMGNATFRWKNPGMDKESALLSFLSYVRKNIDAPIGIDIYGANGWYRSGTRTGQDVEQLAEYVDVICPMFYPSHFENSFLNYEPKTERPYRIYYYGTYRNTVIGRNKLIIRPWVQAFYLGSSPYDRGYYTDTNGYKYVKQEVFGVRDSVNRGYMYWNGVCDYYAIFKDPGDAPYTGPSLEASSKFRKPALSGGSRGFDNASSEHPRDETPIDSGLSASEGISLWNSVRAQKTKEGASLPKLSDFEKLLSGNEEL
ncbi:putative glycoside hydrolase [Treponema zioleckii]|uniref:putative glycoside hydrolase n=1 Tax=Treponema zioleckii TaxID=331680 RepID=UPI001F5BC06E|nr:putative glycoside hydrolase [Treponema zioleckii]